MPDRDAGRIRLRADRDHADGRAATPPAIPGPTPGDAPVDCRDFLRLCDETLDAREPLPPVFPPRFESHEESCSSCRSTVAGYRLLGEAFDMLGAPTGAAESLAGLESLRVRSGPSLSRPGASRFLPRLGVAASILGLAWAGPAGWDPPRQRIALAVVAPPPSRLLDDAWNDAARATIALARDASAPATRIGREALISDGPGEVAIDRPREVAAIPVGRPSRLFEAVGERVNAGVRPISGSARHAFSFLLGPAENPNLTEPPPRDTL